MLRNELIFSVGMLSIVLTTLAATYLDSQYYFFMPGRGMPVVSPPPSSPVVLIVLVLPLIVFCTRMRDFIFLAAFALPPIVGWPIGVIFHDWQPGAAQYILSLECGLLAVFVWLHNRTHQRRNSLRK